MIQKVIRHGNSMAVVIPKDIARQLGLETGSLVNLERDNERILIRPMIAVPAITPDRRRQLDEITERFRPALTKLAE